MYLIKKKWFYGRVFVTSIKNVNRDCLYLLKEYLTECYVWVDIKYKFKKYFFIKTKLKKKSLMI